MKFSKAATTPEPPGVPDTVQGQVYRENYALLDNLKVHQAKILESAYGANFKEMFLLPYSSELNPIERLWSVLKRKWAQHLLHFTDKVR